MQCKALGWDDLAVALYARARERFAADNSGRSTLTELREVAWGFWALGLTDRDTNRKDIYRRLAALFEEEPVLRTEYNEWLLSALDLTVSARKSKAGTVEALIDGLTDYWDDSHGGVLTEFGFVRRLDRAKTEWATYWELAERGFDAVPALIEHAADERLTRAWKAGFNNFSDNQITVGNLCSRLLNRISNREVRVGLFDSPPDPARAREWFEAAKKVGEEKWLVAHAMPPDKPIVDWKGCAEPLIVRVIGVKYPARLSEVYRAWLKRPYTECWGENFAEEVVLSKLPREQKVILLKESAISGPHFRRVAALEGLARPRSGGAPQLPPCRTGTTLRRTHPPRSGRGRIGIPPAAPVWN